MDTLQITGEKLWRRIERSMEKVEERLLRTVGVLEAAKIPYAVVGGNAVRIWVAQVDEAAVRATRDVDVLIAPEHLPDMRQAMEEAGFFYRETAGVTMFVEREDDSARNGVHVIVSGEMVYADDVEANPEVDPTVQGEQFRMLPLERLVRMKLNSFRLKDRIHLLDFIEVGLVDESWLERFSGTLQERLRGLIDNPDQ